MMQDNEILVEVAYALPNQQLIMQVNMPAGATAEQAIAMSGILAKFPEINLNTNKIGIFGKAVKLDALVRHLDRVEIYRPLIADAKALRRARAANNIK